jgi:LPXTG-motif cell wall-anchored protein
MSGGPGGMGGGPGGNMGGPGGSSSTTSLFTGKGAGISSFYPIIGAVIILIAGIVLWKKRKWISLKLKKQQ